MQASTTQAKLRHSQLLEDLAVNPTSCKAWVAFAKEMTSPDAPPKKHKRNNAAALLVVDKAKANAARSAPEALRAVERVEKLQMVTPAPPLSPTTVTIGGVTRTRREALLYAVQLAPCDADAVYWLVGNQYFRKNRSTAAEAVLSVWSRLSRDSQWK